MSRVLIVTDIGFSFASYALDVCQAQKRASCPEACTICKRRRWGKREGVTRRLTLVFLLCLPSLQTVPKPIALEPCFGNKAAVLSVFVRLPRGLGGIPPPGQSGEEYCCLHWLVKNSLLLPQPHRFA